MLKNIKIKTKLTIAFFVVAIVPVSILFGIFYSTFIDVLISNSLSNEQQRIISKEKDIKVFLQETESGILLLSKLSALNRLINSKDKNEIEVARHELQSDFLAFSEERGIYYQVRYIDENGQEIVRVDSDGSRSYVVSERELQNKKRRYYFEDAMSANKGVVFVSPLDLNIEREEIEVPYDPVIRYATPVFDTQGDPKGIVITNIFANYFLQDIQDKLVDGEKVVLMNQDGYYLLHPKKDKEWGFMFEKEETFYVDYPQAASKLFTNDSGQFFQENIENYITFARIYPSGKDILSSKGSNKAYAQSISKIQGKDYYWVLAIVVEKDLILQRISGITYQILAIFILILAIIAISVFLINRAISKLFKKIQDAIENVDRGSLVSQTGINRQDEIGQILTVFDKVAVVTKNFQEALKQKHLDLEVRVNKRTTELQQANLKLQELDRLKSMFISSMSHELRTPLNSIIGFTGIILQGMSGKITETQRKQLKVVKNSSNYLLILINDIIDVSKIEAGKIEVLIEKFDLSIVMEEVVDFFKVEVAEKGFKIFIDMPGVLMIESDKRRVKQIVINLVSNAIKFTKKGEIKIKVEKKGKRVKISVKDTGIGIRTEDMDKLFIPFSRIHIEGELIKKGTGLGLYLSQKLANFFLGKITAKSKLGAGSEFTLTLPLK